MPEQTHRQRMLAFAGVLTVMFLGSLNFTIVGTAMPRIVSDLGGLALYAWAFTAYSLTSTVAVPIYGTLSDRVGRRPLLLFGIVVFAVASALLGFAQNMPQLIALRALQGIGGGALMSMAFAVIADLFTPIERGRYQGYTGAVWGISSVVGPLVGGLVTDTLGWRWVFFVNLPFALLAFYVITRFLPHAARRRSGRVDVPGALLLILSVTPLLLALGWGGSTYPWLSAITIGLFAAAFVFGAGFAWRQLQSPEPILDLRLLRERTFAVANTAGLLTTAGLFAAITYLPLYIQGVKGSSAAGSGAVLTPLMLGLVTTSTLAGLLVSRTGRYKALIVGGLVLASAVLFATSRLGPDTPTLIAVALMVALGIGLGPVNSLLTLAVQNASRPERLGMATSANQFFRQIGGALAVALYGTILAGRLKADLRSELPAGAAALPPDVRQSVADPQLLTSPQELARVRESVEAVGGPELFAGVLGALRSVLSGGLNEVFLLAGALALAGALLATALPELPLRGKVRSRDHAHTDATAAD